MPALMSKLPTAAELLSLAIDRTDFLGDMSAATMAKDAAYYADAAALIWDDECGSDAPPQIPEALIARVALALAQYGSTVLAARELAEADALADGIASGDLDRNGDPIPYARYP